MDVREVDWAGLAAVAMTAPQVRDVRAGVFRPGWSRLVLELDGPYLVSLSEMQTREDGASIRLGLIPASQAEFAAAAARPEPAGWRCPRRPICRSRWRKARARLWWCWTPAMVASTPEPSATARPRPG